MMERRLLPCERCGRLVAIRSHGLCPACRAKDNGGGLARKGPRRTYPPKMSPLEMFFERHVAILEGTRRSMTGSPIPSPSRANVCHLFPKRIYKSVATDDRNVAYLTLEEHTRLDYLLDTYDLGRIESEFGATGVNILGRMAAIAPDVKENGKLKRRIIEWKAGLTEKGNY